MRKELGQMFIAGFDGTEPPADLLREIADGGIGGVILFRRNIRDPRQVASLCRTLHEAAPGPFLITVDQEGGDVFRLGEPFTVFPEARELGRAGSEARVRRVGRAVARELRAVGINCNHAPVVDVDTNLLNPIIGARSFSQDPEVVARLGVAMIEGLQESGVAATAKHFPGHGDTSRDSHLEMPVVDHSRDRLSRVELTPFRRAAEAGVAMIMTAHVLYTSLDPVRPATLSPLIINDIMRGEIGYDGVVITDSLAMKAISDRWGTGRACIEAVRAGVDLLLCTDDLETALTGRSALEEALNAGEVGEELLIGPIRRIEGLKSRFRISPEEIDIERADRIVGCEEHRALCEEIRGSDSSAIVSE